MRKLGVILATIGAVGLLSAATYGITNACINKSIEDSMTFNPRTILQENAKSEYNFANKKYEKAMKTADNDAKNELLAATLDLAEHARMCYEDAQKLGLNDSSLYGNTQIIIDKTQNQIEKQRFAYKK